MSDVNCVDGDWFAWCNAHLNLESRSVEADPKLEVQGNLRMVQHGFRTIRYVNGVSLSGVVHPSL